MVCSKSRTQSVFLLLAASGLAACFAPKGDAPPDLGEPGLLEGLASAAGLATKEAFDVSWAYVYEDEDALADGFLAAGGVGEAAGDREPEVRRALIDVLAPFRTDDGGYRLENAWHFLVAIA